MNLSKMFKNSKGFNFESSGNKILHNKFVLYFIFILSLLNLFYLATAGDNISVIFFILIGFLTSFFSKNMIIILFVALTASNILKLGIHKNNDFSEGYTTTAKGNITDDDDNIIYAKGTSKYETDEKGNIVDADGNIIEETQTPSSSTPIKSQPSYPIQSTNPPINPVSSCKGNKDCRTSSEYCSNDICVPKCTANSQCGQFEFCDQPSGVCLANPSSTTIAS